MIQFWDTLTLSEIINIPEFTSAMQNSDVLLGADARFDVKAKGRPLPDIKWYAHGYT